MFRFKKSGCRLGLHCLIFEIRQTTDQDLREWVDISCWKKVGIGVEIWTKWISDIITMALWLRAHYSSEHEDCGSSLWCEGRTYETVMIRIEWIFEMPNGCACLVPATERRQKWITKNREFGWQIMDFQMVCVWFISKRWFTIWTGVALMMVSRKV